MCENEIELKNSTSSILTQLIDNVVSIGTIEAIGISGAKFVIPEPGQGDIDIFIYCETVPDLDQRRKVLEDNIELFQEIRVDCFSGGHWGNGDFVLINGVETWLMYFSAEDTLKNIEDILGGGYPDKLDNYYYPIGRCAMLSTITIVYDKNGFLSNMKKYVSIYPQDLSRKLVDFHMDALQDFEDLERASTRGDVLFFHFSLDHAIDHFLQALFAANDTYFPSRKRSLELMEGFTTKPVKCEQRLLEIIRLGCVEDTLVQSFHKWNEITAELLACTQKTMMDMKT